MFEAKKDSKILLSFRSLMNRRMNTPGLKLNKPSEDIYHKDKDLVEHLEEPSEVPKQRSFWTKIALSALILSYIRPNNLLDRTPPRVGDCQLEPNAANLPPTILPKPQDHVECDNYNKINDDARSIKALLSKAYNLFGSGAAVTFLEKLQKKKTKKNE